jgi:hypothetical protein
MRMTDVFFLKGAWHTVVDDIMISAEFNSKGAAKAAIKVERDRRRRNMAGLQRHVDKINERWVPWTNRLLELLEISRDGERAYGDLLNKIYDAWEAGKSPEDCASEVIANAAKRIGQMRTVPPLRRWNEWLCAAEKILGLDSLDGNERTDGYSLDFAYDAWKGGLSPDTYASDVRAVRAQIADITESGGEL